jgi:hypothetical protein
MEACVFNSTPQPLYHQERDTVSFCTKKSGPQGQFVRVRKISPSLEFDLRTVQSVVSGYTNYGNPGPPWFF